ncbi:MAG TPA: low-specificity L-threonine aldolase [Gammaproteobacteria bacterium]|nr:low-specificity L-threonine aldolase [Gammaproteobacteria bacterium]
MRIIDLRSDTVTRPSDGMRAAMVAAEVGDDVFGDDPTVARLEGLLAEMAGKEAGVFVPSGTQGNLISLLSHCQRGDEYIVGQTAHTYRYEGGGAAVLGGIQPQPLEFEPDGTLDLAKVAAAIKPDDAHFARTRLLCLENTLHGRVVPLDYFPRARAFTRERGLGLHLDGARVFNAVVQLGITLHDITRHVDSVSICLSKGLGAPVGSVVLGSREFIARARRWRKVVGGGMRQAGILAAAGLYALEHNIARLAEDHANARSLAAGLRRIGDLVVDYDEAQTNMVFVRLPPERATGIVEFMQERGIRILGGNPLRLVTHLDVHGEDIPVVVRAFEEFMEKTARRSR